MIENHILNKLIYDEDYLRAALPFLKEEYFFDKKEKIVFKLINSFVKKYNKVPTTDALIIDVNNLISDSKSNDYISDDELKNICEYITNLKEPNVDKQWLIDNTEKFCQEKALYNAVMTSIQIMDGRNTNLDKGFIPQILSDALAVSFDTSVGHDYIEDYEKRYDFYHKKEHKIQFDLDYFNRITKGGYSKKTLNIVLAGTGVGKSLFMCHCAAANLVAGYNVLYITLEMAEERIAERIDANLLNIQLDQLAVLPKDVYEKKVQRIREKTTGKLKIKEYPTASAGANHFRYLLNELRLKQAFKPDIIYIDYLNICISSRLKAGSNVNSYTYVKSIAEELRGLAVEFDVPIISATQTTRSGYSNTDIELTDTSESFGLPATADFMFALINSEELESLNQLMVKQLKNRYNDPTLHRRFVIGVDRSRFKLYDTEQLSQNDIIDDSPVFDNSNSGDRIKIERKFNKNKFEDFF